jgi:alanine-glyoxylate transaminase / serine-glyoxylate transaminase / serine-pyruvate transaminase
LAAMGRPMLGHLDPDLHEILLEVVSMLRRAYRMPDGLVLPLHCTGMAGMETGIANLLEPGDTAVVARAGFFGGRIAEIARRYGVNVVEVEADWGEAVPNERILQALDEHPETRLVAVVHAETSTGVEHPLPQLGAALRGRDTLLMADCVTSLGGVELDVGGWGVDYAYSCTQKCLAAPPGMSPVAVSEAALERIRARTQPVPFSFDLLLLERYWIERPPAYHHTAPILHIYALHEALRLVLEEGLEARWARHAEAGEHLQRGIAERGLELLADPERQLAPLTAVRVPGGIDGKAVQSDLLRRHGIEVGGGLGPSAPAMWRIGLMGRNASAEIADRVLTALDEALAEEREPALAGSASP